MRKSKTNAQKIRNRYAQLVVRAGDHNKAEILYEYDRAMDRLARLYLFANSAPSEDEIEIQERSERLAKDDLLNFSVHCRRLFEITKAFPLAKASEYQRVNLKRTLIALYGDHPTNLVKPFGRL